MMTFEEGVLNAKFDLYFKFELVSAADSLQDLGERELPSFPMGCDVSFDDLSDLSDFKKVLQMRLDELEEAFKEKADVESLLEEYKERMSLAEQVLLGNWLVNLYDELKMAHLQAKAELRSTELRKLMALSEEQKSEVFEEDVAPASGIEAILKEVPLTERYEPDDASIKRMMLEAVMSPETKPGRCLFCNQEGHSMLKCRLNAMERSIVVFDTERCTRYLEKSHRVVDCIARMCGICRADHHPALCDFLQSPRGQRFMRRSEHKGSRIQREAKHVGIRVHPPEGETNSTQPSGKTL